MLIPMSALIASSKLQLFDCTGQLIESNRILKTDPIYWMCFSLVDCRAAGQFIDSVTQLEVPT